MSLPLLTNLAEAPAVLARINVLHEALEADTLTAVSALTVDSTWDADAATVVNSIRVTLNEIKTLLLAMGASAT